jgi:hypothetical protein
VLYVQDEAIEVIQAIYMETAKHTNGLKMTVFWDVAPCNLVEIYRHFTGTCCLHHQGDDIPDDGSSKYF